MVLQKKAVPTRLESIKKRLIGLLLWVLLAFGVLGLFFGLTWWFYEEVMAFLLLPSGGLLSATGRPIYTAPTDGFAIKLFIAMKGGLTPFMLTALCAGVWFFWPIMPRRYQRFLAWFLPAAFLMWIGGMAFAYFVLLPKSLGFLLSFGTEVGDYLITATSYVEFVYMMLVWLGIIFQLPLAMLVCSKFRIISWKRFLWFDRFTVPTLYIFSIIITPTTDFFNTVLVFIPLLLLYQLGLFLAWLARPRT